jgi:serine/threonine-protein kinase RsbW
MKPDVSSASLHIAANLENLAAIRGFVEETARALGIAPATVTEVVLAVDEAATNTVVHGYRSKSGTIDIEMKREGETLLICLRDEASPFDPTAVSTPDITVPLEQRVAGGLGIHLIRQIMDEVTHRITSQGGNELGLVKRLDGGAQ